MLLKFFRKEEGGLNYLLRNPTAVILDGNPDLAWLLTESLPNRCGQRYTAGVLSEVGDVNDHILIAARKEAEHQMLGGLYPQSLNFVWVAHRDKGRLEQHFYTVNMELISGKHFNPYIDRIDRNRFRDWMEKFNLHHGLPDPFSIIRLKPNYSRSRLPLADQEFLMKIWELVDVKVKSGMVTDRSELVEYLNFAGFHPRASTQDGKPLQQIAVPRPDGSPLRLKGSIYFRHDFKAEMLSKSHEQETPQAIQGRIEKLAERVACGLEFRAHHSIGHLFGRALQRGVGRGQAVKTLQILSVSATNKLVIKKPPVPFFQEACIQETAMLLEKLSTSVNASGQHEYPELSDLPQHLSFSSRKKKHAESVIPPTKKKIDDEPLQILQPVQFSPKTKKIQGLKPKAHKISGPSPIMQG